MPVAMSIRRIIISDLHEQHFVELKETQGNRRFMIVVGRCEADSLDRRIKKQQTPRPLTHDLILQLIHDVGGQLTEVLINDLQDGVYFAKLMVDIDGDTLEVDSRPSDALPLAVSANVPILVAEDVLDEASSS